MLKTVSLVCLVSVFELLSSCSPNNVDVDNSLKKFFDDNHVTGCFAVLNNATNMFTVYDLKRFRDSAYSPGSSFDIVTSLVGLQTGVISSDSMKLNDGEKEINMVEALRSSSVPYFRQVSQRIGKDTMQFWVDSLFQHTKKINSSPDSFWLDDSFTLIADQELGLIRRLYFKQLPFFQPYQDMLHHALLLEDNSNYKLAYKIGPGQRSNGNRFCWVPGWIEENRHPYFFVLFIESNQSQAELKTTALKMLKDILKQQGFLEGKM